MIDGADRARFVEAKTELQKLVANEALQVRTCRSIDKQDVSWLIVSNKQDLPGCANTAEIEQSFELHTYWLMEGGNENRLFAERPYSIIETSLVTGIGVDKIKSWLEEECI